MIRMNTIAVGDRVRHQETGAVGTVTAVNKTVNGLGDHILVELPSEEISASAHHLAMWDKIKLPALPWDELNPGQQKLAAMGHLVAQAQEALADEHEGNLRKYLDALSIMAADMLDEIR